MKKATANQKIEVLNSTIEELKKAKDQQDEIRKGIKAELDALKEEMQSTIRYFHTHDGDGLIVNETFELIDRVADCREIFSQLEGTLSATWDVIYELAKKYYEENGNLRVCLHEST